MSCEYDGDHSFEPWYAHEFAWWYWNITPVYNNHINTYSEPVHINKKNSGFLNFKSENNYGLLMSL